jgi:hypothetical protein
MDPHDEQFESFLREFQPHRPRPLPVTGSYRPKWIFRVAAAVLLTFALGTSMWLLRREHTPHNSQQITKNTPTIAGSPAAQFPLSPISLTRIALEDPSRFDAALANASRHELPNFQGDESTLRVLAKE